MEPRSSSTRGSWRESVDALRDTPSPIVFIVGPTASGKTALALEIASYLSAEIISADSRQVYRGMDIGTAKIPLSERRGIRHHLIDVATPDCPFTLADYLRLSRRILADAAGANQPLVVVGGTGLYVDALLHQFQIPEGDDASTRADLTTWTLGDMLQELDRLSPADGLAVDRCNRRRVERALAYVQATGSPFFAKRSRGATLPGTCTISIQVEPELLRRRIERRVHWMVDHGLVGEVQSLVELYGEGAPGLQSIGYVELLPVVRGTGHLDAAVREIITHTQQYAKRQRTWVRHMTDVVWMRSD